MWGFLGNITIDDINEGVLKNSCKFLTCRGPDSNVTKLFTNNETNVFLSFHRLKILDLNDLANQPMYSDRFKTYCMFNGEIYNHEKLRRELEAKNVKFSTSHSDSEVVLNGISYFGIEYVQKLRGQFSIFFLSLNEDKAYLVSDRVSQKPLYYNLEKNNILFSSNLKSLVMSKGNYSINYNNLQEFLAYGIVSSPNTIFDNFYKLNPASILEISLGKEKFEIKENVYWKPESFIDNKELVEDEFFSILNEAVSLRSKADVEIANFASGGIDSTAVIKNMVDNNYKINTFSVHIDDPKYDERIWSRKVAEKYDTNHDSVEVLSSIDTFKINESLESLDEPYSDPSVIPSYLLCKEISKKYKVAISGDGGDELLGGYKRINTIIENTNSFVSNLYHIYPSFLGTGNKFLMKSNDKNRAYNLFFKDEKYLKLLGLNPSEVVNNINLENNSDIYKSMLIEDYKYYLPQMMMFKVDRTSMANSLEVRSPFVDHKLIEFVMSHNLNNQKLRNKTILKDYLLSDFSKDFVNREKKGFIFNLEGWVFNNLNEINQVINILDGFNLNFKKINLLKINKSRINANRIWRLYVLSKYLFSIKNL